MVSSSIPITPRKFRSDLYSSYQEDSNIPLVIYVVASLLERSIAKNERIATKCSRALSMDSRSLAAFEFDCYQVPNMEIQSFLERIFRYTRVGPPVYVVAYVYIDRLSQIHPEFRITSTNVHRLLITTIMVASKFVEDMNYSNSYFAKVGGLTTNQMNKLEVDFLFLVGFKLHVNVSVFKSYCCHLEREVSVGGGYQIESTLKSLWTEAEEIKSISSKGRK